MGKMQFCGLTFLLVVSRCTRKQLNWWNKVSENVSKMWECKIQQQQQAKFQSSCGDLLVWTSLVRKHYLNEKRVTLTRSFHAMIDYYGCFSLFNNTPVAIALSVCKVDCIVCTLQSMLFCNPKLSCMSLSPFLAIAKQLHVEFRGL